MDKKVLLAAGLAMTVATLPAYAGGQPARADEVNAQFADVGTRLASVEDAIALLGGGISRASVDASPEVINFRDLRASGFCDRMQRTYVRLGDTRFELTETITNSADGAPASGPGCTSTIRTFEIIDGDLRLVNRKFLAASGAVLQDLSYTPAILIYKNTMIPGQSYAALTAFDIRVGSATFKTTDMLVSQYHAVDSVALAGNYTGCIAFEFNQGDASYRLTTFACKDVGVVAIHESAESLSFVPVSTPFGSTTVNNYTKYNKVWVRE